MPAVYKLIEILNEKGINADVIFISRDEKDDIRKYHKLKFNQLNNINFFIFPFYKALIPGLTYLKIRHIINAFKLIYRNKYNLIYCDRVNVEYGGLFSRLGYKVLLRLHGVAYLYENLKPFKKFGIPSMEYFLGYGAPFKAVLCTKDGSPGYHFINKFMRNTLKTKFMLSGTNIDRNSRKIFDIKEKYNLDPNIKVIMTTGRLSFDKAPDLFIKSIIQLNRLNENYFVILIGDGPMRQDLENSVKKAGLENKIIFFGRLDHSLILPLLQQADIFVSLNMCGNLSNAVLEAIHSGKCIITLDHSAETKRDEHVKIKELREALILIDRNMIIEKLPSKINQLINNTNLINQKAKAVKTLGEKYLISWKTRINNEIDFIEQLAKE